MLGECIFIYWLTTNSKSNEILWWHQSINDNFDFTSGDVIYEVKTTNNSYRKHLIKYNQHQILVNDYRKSKYYVSVLVIDTEPDIDLKNLISEIQIKLFGEELHHFNNIIQKYKKEIFDNPFKFNLNESIKSIKFVSSEDIGDIHIENRFIDFESLNIPIKFDFIH